MYTSGAYYENLFAYCENLFIWKGRRSVQSKKYVAKTPLEYFVKGLMFLLVPFFVSEIK